MTDHLKLLFDQLRQTDQHLADQETAIEETRTLRRQAHDALWVAIDAELDATSEAKSLKDHVRDLNDSVQALQTLVLELSARLPPPRPEDPHA